MKKMFRKMVSMVSAMVLTFSCSISIIKNVNNVSVTANASEESQYTELIEEMAVKFNEAREELGLEPLKIVPYINEISQVRAEEQPILYSHTRPDGSFFASIIDVNTVDYKTSGEILAAGSSDVDSIFTAWKNSPKHWTNITKPEFTHVGIGLTYDANSDGKWYWAAIFVGMWEDSSPLEGERMPGKVPMVNGVKENAEFILGDATQDGMIAVSDATFALSAYTSISSGIDPKLTEAQFKAIDVDGDGIITGTDANKILRYATLLSSGISPDWSNM